MSGVKLPRAVQAQADAADAALAELNNPQIDGGDPEPSQGIANAPEPETDPPVEGQAPNGEAAGEPAIPEPGDDDGSPQGDDLNVDWQAEAEGLREQRDHLSNQLSTLQGKYKAEVPRLHDEIKDLKVKLEAQPAPTAETAKSTIDDSEIREMYGDEIADVLARQSATIAQMSQQLEKVQPRMERIDQIENQSHEQRQDVMFEAVGKKHGDWQKINGLATFHKFLAETYPGTRMTRQELIDDAVNTYDAAPIIHQLSQFKKRLKQGNSRMASQVVPGSTGRTEPAPAKDDGYYKLADIEKFRVACANSVSKGRPLTDEQKRLDVTYEAALREGRVT